VRVSSVDSASRLDRSVSCAGRGAQAESRHYVVDFVLLRLVIPDVVVGGVLGRTLAASNDAALLCTVGGPHVPKRAVCQRDESRRIQSMSASPSAGLRALPASKSIANCVTETEGNSAFGQPRWNTIGS
jgi:hypothetical protein